MAAQGGRHQDACRRHEDARHCWDGHEGAVMRFEHSRVLVTGAAGGIGAAVTAMFRREGALVCATDLDSAGMEAEAVLAGDLTDPQFADSLPRMAADALGGLDILVNNAGYMARGKVTRRMMTACPVRLPSMSRRRSGSAARRCRSCLPTKRAARLSCRLLLGASPGAAHALCCMTRRRLPR